MNKKNICNIFLACCMIFYTSVFASEEIEKPEPVQATEVTEPRIVFEAEKENYWVPPKAPIKKYDRHSECDHYNATIIWNYMKDIGYSDCVCAGIMGNMMVECAGCTFYIDEYAYSSDGFYGICQWGGYYPEVYDTDLNFQLEFLAGTIENEFNSFGETFGYSFDDFMNISDPAEAAVVFAQVYERCDSFSYGARQSCAWDAYEHFGGD